MPLHPVPIIIGTTIALVGSGYAFKKFIYDPHLAPLIEALLAAHNGTSLPIPRQRRSSHVREPIPVRAQAIGTTTARRDHHTNLRRRSAGRRESVEVHELREPLISRRSASLVFEELGEVEETRSLRRSADLIDLSVEETEVREVIFKVPTPLGSRVESRAATPPPTLLVQPASMIVEPTRHPSPTLSARSMHLGPEAASTTFSFLSLSQVSSPEAADHRMPHTSPSFSLGRLVSLDAARPAREDDVISINTSTSGYEDAEAYSPMSGAMSPARLHASPRLDAVQELGLRFVGPEAPEALSARRGPLSVISMSDDEGWGADSDWDGALSESEAARG